MASVGKRDIRWGIIGLGNIANKFATDLVAVEGAELYAVASREQQKADDFLTKFNAKVAYNSYQALVNDPNVDAVYIATPHAYHQQHSLLCLEQGIAVLCEKPFAMDIEQVDTMIALAQEKKVLLMEALWTFFLPHYRYVLNELNNKTFGNIVKIEADFGFVRKFDNQSRLFRKSLGGGSLLDIGIYPIFAALSTLGMPNKISANAEYFGNGADSCCTMEFHYDQATASLHSTLKENTPCEAIFYCEHGTIKINKGFHGPATVSVITDADEQTIDFNYTSNGYNFEIMHFNELLRQGKTASDIMTFEFSQQLMQTLDKVRALIGLNYSLEP